MRCPYTDLPGAFAHNCVFGDPYHSNTKEYYHHGTRSDPPTVSIPLLFRGHVSMTSSPTHLLVRLDIEQVLVTLRAFDPARLRPQNCAFHPQGTLLAIGFSSGACKILDAADLEEVASFRYTSASLSTVRFSPDGEMVSLGWSCEWKLKTLGGRWFGEKRSPRK